MSRAEASTGGQAASAPALGPGYLGRSAQPLTGLVFLLPFIALYEVGTRFFLTDPVEGTQHIVAFTMMQDFFALFGAYGQHLPALALTGILFAWHLARKDAWSIRLGTLLGMLLESIVLAGPLLLVGVAMTRYLPLNTSTDDRFIESVIMSFGAGVYEEMVFRLIVCTASAILLRNLLKISPRMSMLLLVVISATSFSAYHYLGTEAFAWRNFVFRAIAGGYFAGVFLTRGFGVTAGSHMAYDLMILSF
jgi:hypothetical protein